MLLEVTNMLHRMEERIGNGAMVEVYPSMSGDGLTIRVKWLLGDRLKSWTTTVTKQELSSVALDVEQLIEDRTVHFAITVIEKSKQGLSL